MRNQWIYCLVGALSLGAAGCQNTDTETVTQSAKAAKTDVAAKGEAKGASADKAKTANGKATKELVATGDKTASATAKGGLGSTTALKEGDNAPAIELTLQDGKKVKLASLKGKSVALYFYPMDDTPGCTVEAQGIRDEWSAFEKAGIQVFGVSMQDAASHQAFIAKHKLPFPLVVDSGSVSKAFGVNVADGKFASRNTFLIGTDGKVKKIWLKVDPSKHAKELLAAAGA